MVGFFSNIDRIGGLWSRSRSDHRCQPGHSQEIVCCGRNAALLFELPSTHKSAASQAALRLGACVFRFLLCFVVAIHLCLPLGSLPDISAMACAQQRHRASHRYRTHFHCHLFPTYGTSSRNHTRTTHLLQPGFSIDRAFDRQFTVQSSSIQARTISLAVTPSCGSLVTRWALSRTLRRATLLEHGRACDEDQQCQDGRTPGGQCGNRVGQAGAQSSPRYDVGRAGAE